MPAHYVYDRRPFLHDNPNINDRVRDIEDLLYKLLFGERLSMAGVPPSHVSSDNIDTFTAVKHFLDWSCEWAHTSPASVRDISPLLPTRHRSLDADEAEFPLVLSNGSHLYFLLFDERQEFLELSASVRQNPLYRVHTQFHFLLCGDERTPPVSVSGTGRVSASSLSYRYGDVGHAGLG
ncbi:hypothetical protein BD410DRAFT_319774 [Rickenella mellea]|uniref:Uncharacterized protein n=1 Tax=Rickenella mellea TaxID=50990 RepID=A0A4Y7PZS7_9AGAM|nr:hypothetical protein BD410DRAFT_319774 [Rickenella mellea]